MFTLFSYCTSRQHHHHHGNTLRAQTEHMTPETRQSLTQKIAETLNEGDDVEDGINNPNVEAILDQVETDLEKAHTHLATLQEKEEFLAIRIGKYQSLLKQQGDHLKQLQQSSMTHNNRVDDDETQQAEQVHYQQQLAKSKAHREALGKVVDVHLTLLKSIKDCQRTIATLEQKKYELKTVTNKCREFLILAEEAEREQQLGVVHVEEEEEQELEPLRAQQDQRQSMEEKEADATANGTRTTNNEEEDEEVEQQGDEEEATGLLRSGSDSELVGTTTPTSNSKEIELTSKDA